MLTEGGALILGAEQPATLHRRYYQFDEILETPRVAAGRDHQPVKFVTSYELLDLIRDLG